jgi:hypothetical protein
MVKLGRLRLPTRSNVKLSEERAHAVFSSCRVSRRGFWRTEFRINPVPCKPESSSGIGGRRGCTELECALSTIGPPCQAGWRLIDTETDSDRDVIRRLFKPITAECRCVYAVTAGWTSGLMARSTPC